MLCDEPTGALDSATGIRVLDALEQVNSRMGTSTVIITHNADIARMAHRVLYMADGRIVREQVNEQRIAARELHW
jgi:putative ABC transport system ATP-binding protein